MYDKDGFPAKDFNGVSERVDKLNLENPELQYHVVWSNECIGFWSILHFAYYTSNNHRSECVRFLNDKFTELEDGKYQKYRRDIFDVLIEKGSPKLVIQYAKRIIEENSGKMPSEIAPG